MPERPLSPHLQVYRFGYTMSLSILHRIAGLALGFALIGLTGWLMAAAGGPDTYAQAVRLLNAWPSRVLCALALIALCYHFCNGLRHLAWDLGLGFERREARRSAALMLIVAGAAALACVVALLHGAARP
ncbi:MAG TPA: succinate dehydrogenase, cytochrome b556 subunit [Steroidobacteraceae bacterium]|nr:succinate dehydrogenase, cytochrome b556 subunit [Steroidobacteraceae bacterium]